MKNKSKPIDKKLVIRIILFAVAFITAIVAFTKGVLSLSNNKEGYQTIEASSDKEAILYANDFTFTYYFEGKSREIRELKNAVTEVYSGALCRAYKLLDPDNEYEGFVNLATLNRKAGETVQVSEELYRILKDAYGRTAQNAGYSMFAGALYDYVKSILILTDPLEFDPVNDPETEERIAALAGLGDEKYFGLRFIDDAECTVCFEITGQYRKSAQELEAEGYMPLDLNLLRDAYILEIVVRALDEAGYTNGYLTAKSGLTYALSKQNGLEYCIYGLKDGIPAIIKTLQSESRTVYSMFKAFGFENESLYYKFTQNGETIYRNPYIGADNGRSSDDLLALYSVLTIDDMSGKAYNIADTVYCNIGWWTGNVGYPTDSVFDKYFVLKSASDILSGYEVLQ